MGLFKQEYLFNLNTINFPDGGVYVFGPYAGGTSQLGIGSENNVMHQLCLDVDLVRVEARAYVSGTLGSAEELTIDCYVNSGASSTTVINLALTDRINYATSGDISISLGSTDFWDWLLTCPTWTTNPTNTGGLVLTAWFETNLDRDLFYHRFYGSVGSAGNWNPASTLRYYVGMGSDLVNTTQYHPLVMPFDCTIVGADLNCRNSGAGSADGVTTNAVIDGTPTLIDNTWRWNNGRDTILKGLDSISIPYTAGQTLNPVLDCPSWSVAPTGTCQSIGLLFERT